MLDITFYFVLFSQTFLCAAVICRVFLFCNVRGEKEEEEPESQVSADLIQR